MSETPAPKLDGSRDPSDPVEDLIAACLEAPEGKRREHFEALCREHPTLAPQLRERARLLEAFGLAFDDGEPDLPSSIGDFEILRRIGQGGMGVVFEARQITLGRSVALKLIRPDQMFFEGARERFRREAQAIAKLAHPGIVPVYLVGEEGGLPYFAMELVHGCTLDEALRAVAGLAPEALSGDELARLVARAANARTSLPPAEQASAFQGVSWVEACVGIVRQVADALEHAHSHGIVHRDVKPSNIALATDGRARLLDFGLTSRADSGRMTRSGSQVGTILYMPPEQMRDRARPDARADVYSLGVVLYELLSLQLPYRGDDALAIMRAAMDARPDSIRARNRRVPSDLETVCLVAMERDPVRRYASAAAFARDLGNVLARRPIEARPPGTLVRARRLAQRYPARAASAILGLLLVGGVPLALYLQKSAYAKDLEDSLEAVRQADRAKDVALAQQRESALDMERSLEFVTGLFERAAPSVAQGRQYDLRDLLELGAATVGRDLEERPLAKARIQMAMGFSLLELGDSQLAMGQFESAAAIYAKFTPLEHPEWHGRALRSLGDAHSNLGNSARALELYGEALEVLDPKLDEPALERSVVLAARAWVLSNTGRIEAARDDLLEARSLAAPLPISRPATLAHIDARLAMLLAAEKKFEQAELLIDPALASMREHHEDASVRLVEALNLRGLISRRLGDNAAAKASYEEALEYARFFYKREGTVHADLYLNLAAVEGACAAPRREVELLRRALQLFEAELGPEHAKTALCGGNLAGALSRQQRWAEAEEIYGVVIARQIAAYGPQHMFVGFSLRNLAHGALSRGDDQRAADLYFEAGQLLLETSGQEDPAIECLVRSAYCSTLLGRPELAERILLDALEVSEQRLPHPPGALFLGLADACDKLGRDAQARAWRERAP